MAKGPFKKWFEKLREDVDGPADLAAFLVGSATGLVLVDIPSWGVSSGTGAVAGGIGGLGAKRGFDAAFSRKKMIRECEEWIQVFEQREKYEAVTALKTLLHEMKTVRSRRVAQFRKELDKIVSKNR